MINCNNIRARQRREDRLAIVAKMYKKGHSIREIREEVISRLGGTCSTRTVCNDIALLLKEWREERVGDIDDKVELELRRIDYACSELWEQWEKSKEDYQRTQDKRVGVPGEAAPGGNGEVQIQTVRREQVTGNVVGLGNPSYISEIRLQLAERRKLLGLYAPEKRELSGKFNTQVNIADMTEEQIKAEIDRIRQSSAIE